MDPLVAGLIAGGGVAQSGLSILGQHQANRANRALSQDAAQNNLNAMREQNQFNLMEAEKARNWDLQMWHRSNEYSSPLAQMERFAKAGLNPNLIYGQQNTGFQPTPSKQASGANYAGSPTIEQRNVLGGITAFQDIISAMLTQSQVKTQQANIDVAMQEALKKAQETANLAIDADQKAFDLGISKELRETNVQAAMSNLAKLQAEVTKENYLAGQEEQRLKTMTETQKIEVSKAAAQLEETLTKIQGLSLDNQFKQFQNDITEIKAGMLEQGITDSDNVIFRIMSQNPELAKYVPWIAPILNLRRPDLKRIHRTGTTQTRPNKNIKR